MLKSKFKILLPIFLIIVLLASCCFATTETQPVETTGEKQSKEATTTSQVTTNQTESTTTSQNNTGAQSSNNQNLATVQDWLTADYFNINTNVNLKDVVDSNAFIIGKDVTISGEIGGDLYVIADKLTIDGGYIYSNLFAIASEITINGTVYDVYAMCNNFNLASNGFIYRDMRVSANNINISGRVKRNAYISTDNLTLANNGGELISGNLDYNSHHKFDIPESSVKGKVNFSQESSDGKQKNMFVSNLLDLAKSLLFTFVLTVVLLWLSPKAIKKVTNTPLKNAILSIGISILAIICIALVSFVLIFSIIGIQVSICLLLAFAIIAFIGKSITSIYFGNILARKLKKEGNSYLILFSLVVTLILWVISILPVISGFVTTIASLLGIGLVLLNMISKKEKIKE